MPTEVSCVPSDAERRAIAHRIAGRFPNSAWLRGYIRGKIRIDPAYEAVAQRLLADPPAAVLDLGCGLGLLSFYLRERGVAAPILGVDTATDKIAQATVVARNFDGLRFAVGDAAVPPPVAPVTVALDILHYLDARRQRALLDHLAREMPPGGMVIIRNAPREAHWRFWLVVAEEFWVRASRWIATDAPINFPSIPEVIAPFATVGCQVEHRPLWGRTPFNSHLFIFTKSA